MTQKNIILTRHLHLHNFINFYKFENVTVARGSDQLDMLYNKMKSFSAFIIKCIQLYKSKQTNRCFDVGINLLQKYRPSEIHIYNWIWNNNFNVKKVLC